MENCFKKSNVCRAMTRNLILKGVLKNPDKCSKCKSKKNIIAHHLNYEDPKNIIWVCRKCHKKIHDELGISFSPDIKRIVIDVEEDFHTKFKIYCIGKGNSMGNVLKDLIKKELDY